MPRRVIRNITKPNAVMPILRPARKPLRRLPVEVRHPVDEAELSGICDGDRRFCDHDGFDDGMEVEVNNPRLQIHGMTGTIEFHCEDGTLVVRLDADDECYLLQEDEVI